MTKKRKIIYLIIIGIEIAIIIGLIIDYRISKSNHIGLRTYCKEAVNCTECTSKGTRECNYYTTDENNNLIISKDTIICDCEMEKNNE